MKKSFKVIITLFCLSIVTNFVQAAELDDPYTNFVYGLDNITSAKISSVASFLVYDDNKIASGYVMDSKGSATKISSTTYESSSSIKTVTGTDKESYTTKMDFVRKGDYVYIKFKYGPAKNKWIRIEADNYEEFGEAIEMELQFDLADVSDSGGQDEEFLKKIATVAEKNNLFVNYDKPLVKKKKGTTLTTYFLEFDRKSLIPYYTELANVLTEEEKNKSVLSIKGFTDALKSKFFVDSLVKESYVMITFDDATGLPIEYTESLVVPQYKGIGDSFEQFAYMKFDNINKNVKIAAPKKFISTDDALKLMGLDD